ncbi:MAG TPA: pyridoxamine 5'-phosphate oxidase family protein [Nocardioidaceae bacterium]|nr:pyridoxamine 5'-phosphate oxidase family protein [Nocardioidaceae bacterium]
MASQGRDLVRMSDAEIEEFLAGHKKVQVATVNPDGSPHLTTLFYVVDEGRIAFWTYARSQKVKNLERDPRVTCLVETGDDYFELRGVSVSGRAELVTDEDGIRAIGTAVASRMVDGADLGDIGRGEVERQVRKRVGVVVVPTRTASWDHRKMLTEAGS